MTNKRNTDLAVQRLTPLAACTGCESDSVTTDCDNRQLALSVTRFFRKGLIRRRRKRRKRRRGRERQAERGRQREADRERQIGREICLAN